MPEHLRHLLRGKRLLLLKEVLADLKFPDTKLFDKITQGFTLHGGMESQMFSREKRRDPNTRWTLRIFWADIDQFGAR